MKCGYHLYSDQCCVLNNLIRKRVEDETTDYICKVDPTYSWHVYFITHEIAFDYKNQFPEELVNNMLEAECEGGNINYMFSPFKVVLRWFLPILTPLIREVAERIYEEYPARFSSDEHYHAEAMKICQKARIKYETVLAKRNIKEQQ